jgi:serine/threonine-protein kinase RsbT
MDRAMQIPIVNQSDIAHASRKARDLAVIAGFDKSRSYHVATAASELAWNVLLHGGGGMLEVSLLPGCLGIELLASDAGPGIADPVLAMQEGYSSSGSLGCGLSGIARLMDDLVIDSTVGQGTRVRACKWL